MLTLTLKKKWFDMILSGEKKQEYRDIKPYYTRRFQKIAAPYYLDDAKSWNRMWEEECRVGWFADDPLEVCFRNGYAKDAPTFCARVSLRIGTGRPEWGAEDGREYYVLDIHEIREA